eukprot:GFKZ01000936.1.p1 GENE.GFKZ01000936.1~~GFKZ01000936.1.p1  ORF type:complete len:453 (-),score=43.51 GFKZ01000936.1:1505-2863(-)
MQARPPPVPTLQEFRLPSVAIPSTNTFCPPPWVLTPNPNFHFREVAARSRQTISFNSFLPEVSCLIFGRDLAASHIFVGHPTVSGQHAAAVWSQDDGKCYIIDLESANGTYINSNLVSHSQRHELKPGDELVFGKSSHIFVFERKPNTGGPSPPSAPPANLSPLPPRDHGMAPRRLSPPPLDRRAPPPEHMDRRPPPPDHMDRRPHPPGHMDRRPPPDLMDRRPPPDPMDRRPPPPGHMDRRPPPDHMDRRPPPPDQMDRRPLPPDHMDRRPPPPDHMDRRPPPPDHMGRRPLPPDHMDRRPPPPDHMDRRPLPPDHFDRRPPPPDPRFDRRRDFGIGGPPSPHPRRHSPPPPHRRHSPPPPHHRSPNSPSHMGPPPRGFDPRGDFGVRAHSPGGRGMPGPGPSPGQRRFSDERRSPRGSPRFRGRGGGGFRRDGPPPPRGDGRYDGRNGGF